MLRVIARLLDRADAGYDPFFSDPAAVEDDYRRLANRRWQRPAPQPVYRRSSARRGWRPAAWQTPDETASGRRESVTARDKSSTCATNSAMTLTNSTQPLRQAAGDLAGGPVRAEELPGPVLAAHLAAPHHVVVYIIMVALLALGINGFVVPVRTMTRQLARKTDRRAEDMYNEFGSARKERTGGLFNGHFAEVCSGSGRCGRRRGPSRTRTPWALRSRPGSATTSGTGR